MEELIKRISLSKEEERKLNIPRYKELYVPNSHYADLLAKEKEYLTVERKKYATDMEFYTAIAMQFARKFIPLLISDYQRQLDEEIIQKLGNIMNGKNLKIFLPGQAVAEGYIQVDDNGRPKGDDGAFAISKLGVIGFTPQSNAVGVSDSEVINNALRMKGSMIHEVFHLLIDVMIEERFRWLKGNKEESQLTSGGFIINEGLVEKYAIEFSKRHNLLHNPSLDYFHYVDLCVAIENRVGIKDFDYMAFHFTYKEIFQSALTMKQLNLYQLHERKKYLEKRGITNIDSILLDSKEVVDIKKL